MRRWLMVVLVLSDLAGTGCRDCYQARTCTPYQPTCCPTYRQPVRTQATPVYTQQQGCVPVCQ